MRARGPRCADREARSASSTGFPYNGYLLPRRTPLDALGNSGQMLWPVELLSKFIFLRKGGFGKAARPELWRMNGDVGGCLLRSKAESLAAF